MPLPKNSPPLSVDNFVELPPPVEPAEDRNIYPWDDDSFGHLNVRVPRCILLGAKLIAEHRRTSLARYIADLIIKELVKSAPSWLEEALFLLHRKYPEKERTEAEKKELKAFIDYLNGIIAEST